MAPAHSPRLAWVRTLLTCVLAALLLVNPTCGRWVGSSVEGEKIRVFLVPHTHCDAGWIKTYEEYQKYVNDILDTVITALKDDPARRFVWSEISFFSVWYTKHASQMKKDFLAKFLAEQRWEFVGGGWVQHDEAVASSDSILEQLSEGFSWLATNMHVRPRYGWQIDSFGHSAFTAALFADMGLRGVVLNRVHYRTKEHFRAHRMLQFRWSPPFEAGPATSNTDAPPSDGSILAILLNNTYASPAGFDFEKLGGVADDHVARKAQALVRHIRSQRAAQQTPILLVPVGDDFRYAYADSQFKNWEKIVNHITERNSEFGGDIELGWATVDEYFTALNEHMSSTKTVLPSFRGHFLPYANNYLDHWSGFYSTRPHLKRLSRDVEQAALVGELVLALYANGPDHTAGEPVVVHGLRGPHGEAECEDEASVAFHQKGYGVFGYEQSTALEFIQGVCRLVSFRAGDILTAARQNTYILPHHNAVTGTAKELVAGDYERRLQWSRKASLALAERLLQRLLLSDQRRASLGREKFVFLPKPPPPATDPPMADVCVPVLVLNTAGWSRNILVHVPLPFTPTGTHFFYVVSSAGDTIHSQLLPDTKGGAVSWQLVFRASIPPAGVLSHFLCARQMENTKPNITAVAEQLGVELPFVHCTTTGKMCPWAEALPKFWGGWNVWKLKQWSVKASIPQGRVNKLANDWLWGPSELFIGAAFNELGNNRRQTENTPRDLGLKVGLVAYPVHKAKGGCYTFRTEFGALPGGGFVFGVGCGMAVFGLLRAAVCCRLCVSGLRSGRNSTRAAHIPKPNGRDRTGTRTGHVLGRKAGIWVLLPCLGTRSLTRRVSFSVFVFLGFFAFGAFLGSLMSTASDPFHAALSGFLVGFPLVWVSSVLAQSTGTVSARAFLSWFVFALFGVLGGSVIGVFQYQWLHARALDPDVSGVLLVGGSLSSQWHFLYSGDSAPALRYGGLAGAVWTRDRVGEGESVLSARLGGVSVARDVELAMRVEAPGLVGRPGLFDWLLGLGGAVRLVGDGGAIGLPSIDHVASSHQLSLFSFLPLLLPGYVFPMTSSVGIQLSPPKSPTTSHPGFSMYSRSSFAVFSPGRGLLDVVLHRRPTYDEGHGLGEGCDTASPVLSEASFKFRPNGRGGLSDAHGDDLAHRREQVLANRPLFVFYGKEWIGRSGISSCLKHKSLSLLTESLPAHVHLQSLVVPHGPAGKDKPKLHVRLQSLDTGVSISEDLAMLLSASFKVRDMGRVGWFDPSGTLPRDRKAVPPVSGMYGVAFF